MSVGVLQVKSREVWKSSTRLRDGNDLSLHYFMARRTKARREELVEALWHIFPEGGEKKVKLWLSRGRILTWKVCMRKDALNGWLHFSFQMCRLSCCLSLRWSLFPVFTSSLRVFSYSFSKNHQCWQTTAQIHRNITKWSHIISAKQTVDQGSHPPHMQSYFRLKSTFKTGVTT